MRALYAIGIVYVACSALLLLEHGRRGGAGATTVRFSGEAGEWFQRIRPYCNPVEVESRHRWMPPPETKEGTSFSAACYALAGKIDRARRLILELPASERWRGAGIVFDVAHPVADAGDDASAGPIMELVVEFWPNHYMALYHAGMSRYALGFPGPARSYLQKFLSHYELDDGWRRNALTVLERLEEE